MVTAIFYPVPIGTKLNLKQLTILKTPDGRIVILIPKNERLLIQAIPRPPVGRRLGRRG